MTVAEPAYETLCLFKPIDEGICPIIRTSLNSVRLNILEENSKEQLSAR
jgi:hypothetical protein